MAEFIRSAGLLQASNYLAVSSISLLVYDYLQNLDLEVKFIWRVKWDLGKIVFLLARYPTFVAISTFIYYMSAPDILPDTCRNILLFVNLTGALVISMAEVILIMRTFALSGRNRWLLGMILAIYIGGAITGIFITAKIVISLKYGISPIPTLRPCSPIAANPLATASFGLILGFEFLILFLTLIIGIRKFRYARSRLVISLYADGISYFIYILLASLANIIIIATGPDELVESLSVLQIVLHSILSCRIVLHVRRDVALSYEQEYDLDTVPFSPIQFNGTEVTRTQAARSR